jgi:hypothetical protein
MNLFSSPKAPEPSEVTATAVLRDALRSHARTPEGLSRLARDINETDGAKIATAVLEEFITGRDLSDDQKVKLTERLYDGSTVYNPTIDRFERKLQPEPKGPPPVSPASFVFDPSKHYDPIAAAKKHHEGSGIVSQPVKPRAPRPGWAA